MAREEHFSHRIPGILGVFCSTPEIVGVFPELSATSIPHAQEIRVRRGDSMEIPVQVQDDEDPPDPVNIDSGVVRWAAKQGFGQTEREGVTVGNEGALIIKRSYDSDEIELAGSGRAIIHVEQEDTFELPLSPAIWDLEITLPGDQIPVADDARIQLIAGSDIVLSVGGVNWETLGARSGDILTVQGRRVLVRGRISPAHLRVDFSGWDTSLTEPFSLSRGRVKTVASGPFVVEGDVVV